MPHVGKGNNMCPLVKILIFVHCDVLYTHIGRIYPFLVHPKFIVFMRKCKLYLLILIGLLLFLASCILNIHNYWCKGKFF